MRTFIGFICTGVLIGACVVACNESGSFWEPEWVNGHNVANGAAQLKQISHVESVGDPGGMITTLYEYDEQGRLIKESIPWYKEGTSMYENGEIIGAMQYIDYIYDEHGLLEKAIRYNANIYAGFQNLQTSVYTYDGDGKKVKVTIEHPKTGISDYITYSYDGSRLVREDNFIGGIVTTQLYTLYEYNTVGELTRELKYSAENTTPYETTEHSYENGLNVLSEVLNCSGKKVRDIRRYFDKKGNLRYLESKETQYSSIKSHILRYDYY